MRAGRPPLAAAGHEPRPGPAGADGAAKGQPAALDFSHLRRETEGVPSCRFAARVLVKGPPMPAASTATDVLNREFLEVRARLLQVAAALDRLDRAAGSVADDPRRQNIDRALDVLRGSAGGRAEQIQLLFSRGYSPQWRKNFEIPAKR